MKALEGLNTGVNWALLRWGVLLKTVKVRVRETVVGVREEK